ncbi:MAG: acylphosphatase [Chlamydiota bacterium]
MFPINRKPNPTSEVHCFVTGTVQNVSFRATTKRHADTLGLTGYVRNLLDQRVEICIAGTKSDADQLIDLLKQEPPPIVIDAVSMTVCTLKTNYHSFEIHTEVA